MGFTEMRTFDEHSRYVMKLVLNPEEKDVFASTSTG